MHLKHNLMHLNNQLLSEILLITCFLSSAIYWIYGIAFRINLFSLSKLLILYLIITPPIILISPKGVDYLKKIFEGRLTILKIYSYLIFTSIAYYSIALQNQIFPLDNISVSRLIQFILTVTIYSFAVTWKPLLFIAGFSALKFFNEKNENTLTLNWQIATLFIVYFILKKLGQLSLYEGIGEPAIRAALAQLMDLIIHTSKINFFQTPALIKHIKSIYFETWIYLLTISLLLPQVIRLQDIGIGKIKATTKIFKQTPIIWIYFIIIILITLFNRRIILSEPMTLLSLFYFVFLKALFEEICFRGVLLTCFLNVLKKLKLKMRDASIIAIFLSTILFVLYHYPLIRLDNIGFIFLFGLLTGRLFYKTNSIMPGLMVHTVINLLLLKT